MLKISVTSLQFFKISFPLNPRMVLQKDALQFDFFQDVTRPLLSGEEWELETTSKNHNFGKKIRAFCGNRSLDNFTGFILYLVSTLYM